MNNKQSQICEICSAYMDFVKNNTWLKCRGCSFMKKVVKTVITPMRKLK